ncbi:MAG TPA: flagellar basal body P-ring protein FlgI [Capsulimonadaceae bacterium]|jgi:flagellar P-ring protein precursor FlgI
MKKVLAAIFIALIIFTAPATTPVSAARLKDIATVQGVRGNQLIGYGLVVGLAGTGDSQQVSVTVQSVSAMLLKLGMNVPQAGLRLKNVAAVMVTADLPAFAKNGSSIDITVSSLGDAPSLQGGTLLQTPLLAANGQTYAVAQGSISVGGFSAGTSSGSVSQNHVTAGRVPSGAIVERDVPTTLGTSTSMSVTLFQPDFTTAARVAAAINMALPNGVEYAHAVDAATVQLGLKPTTDMIGILAQLENVEVAPDMAARVVINERTGTVVLGGDVTVTACAIAQGNLTIRVADDTAVSQPNPFGNGTTVAVPKTNVSVSTGDAHLIGIQASPTIDKVVKALNALGVTPRDLISILQAMKQAGALHAEVEVQ